MHVDELTRRLGHALSAMSPSQTVIFGPGEEIRAQEAARERLSRFGLPSDSAADALKRAAVLVPLVARADGVTMLLTERTPNLADHAGQISFPGGRLEPEDADARAAALRETAEEIGLDRRHIELLGEFEEYGTVTGYRVTPVIGLVRPPFDLTPDPSEVAEIFELPLDFVLQPSNVRRARETRDGVEREIYEIAYGKWRVWGFTARIIVRLIEALDSDGGGVTPQAAVTDRA